MTTEDLHVTGDNARRTTIDGVALLLELNTKDLDYAVTRVDDYTITAGPVTIHHSRQGVNISFPDPFGDNNDTVTVTTTDTRTYGAIVTIVDGLIRILLRDVAS